MLWLEGRIDNIHGLGFCYQNGHLVKRHVRVPVDFLLNLSWEVAYYLELDVLSVVHVAQFG